MRNECMYSCNSYYIEKKACTSRFREFQKHRHRWFDFALNYRFCVETQAGVMNNQLTNNSTKCKQMNMIIFFISSKPLRSKGNITAFWEQNARIVLKSVNLFSQNNAN